MDFFVIMSFYLAWPNIKLEWDIDLTIFISIDNNLKLDVLVQWIHENIFLHWLE